MAECGSGELRRRIVAAYEEGVRSVAPDAAARRVLARRDGGFTIDEDPVPVRGRLVVVAIGKAGASMALAAVQVLGDAIDAGYVLTKDGHAVDVPSGFTVFEAAHPVPDERGIAATQSILDGLAGLKADDVVLALISGGGSALFEAPAGDLSLADIQETTDLLLRAGAPIGHLNAVRLELSQVKGGGFRRRIGAARTVSLILSDVLGNSPEVIASGPTIVRRPDPEGALRVLGRYDIRDRVPVLVRRHLERSRQAVSPGLTGPVERDLFRIIGDNDMFVEAVQHALESEGMTVSRVWLGQEGEAAEQATAWIDALQATEADAIVGGGELTVTVRGHGVGGRNTEFALAAAIELHRRKVSGTVASLASDGQDGGVDAAGAIVDECTVTSLAARGVDALAALARNDSGTALGAIGALVTPGPTGTNVNDVYIGIHTRE